jgi:AcrR family transcriptional regulator
MTKKISKLEAGRRQGRNQVSDRRITILDAAQKLFLENGLENVGMSDIAEAAGITRVSLYRYFPDRDPIVFEIAARMINRLALAAGSQESGRPVTEREFMLAMIDQFDNLRIVYRYLGMFDHLYGDHYPNETLADWFREQVFSVIPSRDELKREEFKEERAQVAVLFNTIMSFLEKMAGRGELMEREQGVSVAEQLKIFRKVILVYLDHIHLKV